MSLTSIFFTHTNFKFHPGGGTKEGEQYPRSGGRNGAYQAQSDRAGARERERPRRVEGVASFARVAEEARGSNSSWKAVGPSFSFTLICPSCFISEASHAVWLAVRNVLGSSTRYAACI